MQKNQKIKAGAIAPRAQPGHAQEPLRLHGISLLFDPPIEKS
jgi:hypothetical protein